MRAWQTMKKDGAVVVQDPNGPDAIIANVARSFVKRARFWQVLGKKAPRVCQFIIEGARYERWFAVVDAKGGLVHLGEHPKPDAVWRSTAADLVRLLRKETNGRELRGAGKLSLSGNLGLLHDLLRASEG